MLVQCTWTSLGLERNLGWEDTVQQEPQFCLINIFKVCCLLQMGQFTEYLEEENHLKNNG